MDRFNPGRRGKYVNYVSFIAQEFRRKKEINVTSSQDRRCAPKILACPLMKHVPKIF